MPDRRQTRTKPVGERDTGPGATDSVSIGSVSIPVTDVRLTDPAGRVHDPGRLAEALAGLLG